MDNKKRVRIGLTLAPDVAEILSKHGRSDDTPGDDRPTRTQIIETCVRYCAQYGPFGWGEDPKPFQVQGQVQVGTKSLKDIFGFGSDDEPEQPQEVLRADSRDAVDTGVNTRGGSETIRPTSRGSLDRQRKAYPKPGNQ